MGALRSAPGLPPGEGGSISGEELLPGGPMTWLAAGVPLGVFIATLWLTGAVLGWLRRKAILDHPVERPSHRIAVPRGGGIAVMAVLVATWLGLLAAGTLAPVMGVLVGISAALALLSWRDDLGGLPILLRLLAHIAAVVLGLALPPETKILSDLLPFWLDRIAAGLLWVWFINLFNFMDGIDGITGVETAALGLGAALVLALAGVADDGTSIMALSVGAAGAAFLAWNWHPAKLILGDVGSVPLGYVLGWLLLHLAGRGLWAPALILPLYYLADASLTMAWRILRREPFWQAHRRHFYQRALARDGDHAAVARIVAAGDAALVALALLSVSRPYLALALAGAVVAAILLLMERRARS
jgi:UDP-N-acetylmuramyl pentapeptide phosphotransferase/UDP-N-acetylglucosamine-1-phosphate transferase